MGRRVTRDRPADSVSGGPVIALKTAVIFVLAAAGELGGTYAVWRWLRTGATPLLALVGLAALFGYAVVQTLQPEARYGRVFAAYAGVFLIGALLWGWLVDGKAPDRFDMLGAAIVLVGIVVILFGRRLFA
jgi:small multidrug resistance family-3 protein